MLTTDKTQVQIALGFLDSCAHPDTGFLPSTAPLRTLPDSLALISGACAELVEHYLGENANCRAWLEEKFQQEQPSWLEAVEQASEATLDAIMTQTSLLCHAHICGNARGAGLSNVAPLPAALDTLWDAVSKKLDVPKAGNFFSLVTSNWDIEGVACGESYNFKSIESGVSTVLHRWLDDRLEVHFDDFLGFFLSMEARGHRLVETIRELLECVMNDSSQEATYHMMMLSANIASLSADFNKAYKKSKSAPEDFEDVFKPTLVLGEEEGASGFQSCSFQLLESFFGLNQETEYAQAVIRARRLMNPERRKMLKVMDMTSDAVRNFVASAKNPKLLEAFNRCISHLKTWRLLYVKRGSLKSKTERKTPIVTQAPLLECDWAEMGFGLDYLFRFLSDEQREKMNHLVEEVTFQAGEALIQQGDLYPGLFELKSGSASVVKTVRGEAEAVDKIGVNEIFGEMSLVEHMPASASIVADQQVVARRITLEAVYDLMNEHEDVEGGFYLALAQLISRRLRNAFPKQ